MKHSILLATLIAISAKVEAKPIQTNLVQSNKHQALQFPPKTGLTGKTDQTHKTFIPEFKRNDSLKVLTKDKLVAGGSEGTGGGDLCEDRIKVVRDDIKNWIKNGGAKPLTLPPGIDEDQYSTSMLSAISRAKVKCVGPGDKGYPIKVSGTPKVCKFTRELNSGQVTCDFNKFQSMNESDHYVLVHHEYAGIAGIEVPNGDDSNYDISNQISAYLVDQVVKKLAVLPSLGSSNWERVTGKIGTQVAQGLADILSQTKFTDCDAQIAGPQPGDIPESCDGGQYWILNLQIGPKSGPQSSMSTWWHPANYFSCEDDKKNPQDLFVSGSPGKEMIRTVHNVTVDNQTYESQYELDPTATFVSKATFSWRKPVWKNLGTVTHPKHVLVAEQQWSFICNGRK